MTSMTSTQQMSPKTRAARIRTAARAAVKRGEFPGVVKISIKTNYASLMAAIDCKIEMEGPARVEVIDAGYGSVWTFTEAADAARAALVAIAQAEGIDAWADNRSTFFTVSPVNGPEPEPAEEPAEFALTSVAAPTSLF